MSFVSILVSLSAFAGSPFELARVDAFVLSGGTIHNGVAYVRQQQSASYPDEIVMLFQDGSVRRKRHRCDKILSDGQHLYEVVESVAFIVLPRTLQRIRRTIPICIGPDGSIVTPETVRWFKARLKKDDQPKLDARSIVASFRSGSGAIIQTKSHTITYSSRTKRFSVFKNSSPASQESGVSERCGLFRLNSTGLEFSLTSIERNRNLNTTKRFVSQDRLGVIERIAGVHNGKCLVQSTFAIAEANAEGGLETLVQFDIRIKQVVVRHGLMLVTTGDGISRLYRL